MKTFRKLRLANAFCINLKEKIMQVHDMSHLTPEQAYDETQSNGAVKDRDVINMGSGNVAIMVKAWPVVACGEIEGFHTIKAAWECFEGGRYEESYKYALEIAA